MSTHRAEQCVPTCVNVTCCTSKKEKHVNNRTFLNVSVNIQTWWKLCWEERRDAHTLHAFACWRSALYVYARWDTLFSPTGTHFYSIMSAVRDQRMSPTFMTKSMGLSMYGKEKPGYTSFWSDFMQMILLCISSRISQNMYMYNVMKCNRWWNEYLKIGSHVDYNLWHPDICKHIWCLNILYMYWPNFAEWIRWWIRQQFRSTRKVPGLEWKAYERLWWWRAATVGTLCYKRRWPFFQIRQHWSNKVNHFQSMFFFYLE